MEYEKIEIFQNMNEMFFDNSHIIGTTWPDYLINRVKPLGKSGDRWAQVIYPDIDQLEKIEKENQRLRKEISILYKKTIIQRYRAFDFETEKLKLAASLKECYCLLKETRSVVIPKLHLGMLLTSAALLPLSAFSLIDFYLTGNYFLNPVIAFALLFLSLGWGTSVGILVVNMGVK